MAEEQPRTAVSSRPLIYICTRDEIEKLVEQMFQAIRAAVPQADIFYDVQLSPGDSFSDKLLERLNEASIVLFCLSPDALKSRYCQREMEIGLSSPGKRLIPIILKPCDWSSSPLGSFIALPGGAKPVSIWKNREEAFADIAGKIGAVVKPAPQVQEKGALPTGHTGRVRRIVVIPDGTRAVSASDDGTAIVWDLATLQPIAVFKHDGPVSDVAVLADGRNVVTSSGNALCLWQLGVDAPALKRPIGLAGSVSSIAAFGAIALVGKGPYVYAARGTDEASTMFRASGSDQSVTTIGSAFPRNSWVVGFSDGVCRQFEEDRPVATVKVARAAIVEIHLLVDGVRALSCSADGSVQVSELKTGTVQEFPVSSRPLAGIAPMPDGARAAVAATEAIRLIDLSTGAILREWPLPTDLPTAIAVTPDGARIVWGTASGKVSARSIDLTTQRPLPVGEDRLRLAYLAVLELPELWAVLESLDESALAGVGSQLQLGPDQDVLQALQSRRPGIEPPPLWTAWMTSLYPSKVGKPQGPR